MNAEYIEVSFSYSEASIIILVLNMYCNGPQFLHVNKELNDTMINTLEQIIEQFYNLKKVIRENKPKLYIIKPYTTEALNTTEKILISKNKLNIIMRVFEITLEEGKWDNYSEIEIHTGTSVSNIYHCLDQLKHIVLSVGDKKQTKQQLQ